MPMKKNCLTAAKLEVGMRHSARLSFSREQVRQYCALSGDHNAIHEDPEDGSEESRLQPAQRRGQRHLGVAPAQLVDDGLEEGGESVEDRSPNVHGDEEGTAHDPPPVEHSRRFHCGQPRG